MHQGIPAGNLTLASYHLGISWDIVVDGDYVLNDIVGSIRDGVYSRVSTLWSATECDYCYFLPSTLSPTAPPSAYVQALSFYFNQSQIAKILGETSLYPYDTAPSAGGMSGAVITLGHLLTDWVVLCPSTYLAALESNTTNPGNVYHALFATGLGSPVTPNPAMCHGRVCHADELYLIFGTSEMDGLYQPLTARQVEVTRDVMKHFAEMAWAGSPNYEVAEIVWEGYGEGNEVMVDVTDSVKYGYRVAQCDFIANELGLVYGDKMYQATGTQSIAASVSIDRDIATLSKSDDRLPHKEQMLLSEFRLHLLVITVFRLDREGTVASNPKFNSLSTACMYTNFKQCAQLLQDDQLPPSFPA